jgi:hypothetical protein
LVKYVETNTLTGAATEIVSVYHNLNTDVVPVVYNVSTGDVILVAATVITSNRLDFTFNNETPGDYKFLIFG